MALKIPDIAQQPVGEFAFGNIPQPNYEARGKAAQELIGATGKVIAEVALQDADTELNEATAGAANDFAELRAKLEKTNTIPSEEIPDEIVHEYGTTITDIKGDRVEIGTPRVFTHEIADEWWKIKSEEITQYWANRISNREARAKFLEDVGTRYVAPGTFAINAASIARRRAYNQAMAEKAVRDTIASDADKAIKEQQAREIIRRQQMLGADPKWVEDRLAEIGPLIDQLEVQNQIFAATTKDQIDLIEEAMYSDETRMTPAQIRTMSAQMDTRRNEFDAEELERQGENAAKAFFELVSPDIPFNEMTVADLVLVGDITNSAGWTLYNALQEGSTTRASDPVALSLYRSAMTALPYTGNRARVKERADLLRLTVSMAAAGLNPNGTPSGLPARLTGTDAAKLRKEIDAIELATLESDEYDRALKQVYTWTHVAVDLEGQITIALGGNQHQVDAALEFKRGLDNYMDAYGADAKPVDYFTANKDAFNPNNFSDGINARFLVAVPQSGQWIVINTAQQTYSFDIAAQEEFVVWFADQRTTMDQQEWNKIDVLFKQYYRGQGLAPLGGRLDLEPDNPMYTQFEALVE